MHWRTIDITGQVFGRLTAVEHVGQNKWRESVWRLKCECGNDHEATYKNLKKGYITSCGCLRKEVTSARHLRSSEPFIRTMPREYRTYYGMVQRCTNPKTKKSHHYIGRGIKVCDRWLYGEDGLTGLDCFIKDMGPRPPGRMSIDRINNDGDYEPGNCRWATYSQQNKNKRYRA